MWGGSRGAGLGGPSGLALREMFAAVHKLQIQKKSSGESAARKTVKNFRENFSTKYKLPLYLPTPALAPAR